MSQGFALYPYRLSSLVDLTLSEFEDTDSGEPVKIHRGLSDKAKGIVGDARNYDVFSGGGKWTKLTFKVTASLAETELQKVLPSGSRAESDTVLNVRITCPVTKFRHSLRLPICDRGVWTGYTTLQREDIAHSVIARPELVRVKTIDGGSESPFATNAGSILAFGEPCFVTVDPEPNRDESGIALAWEDFANSESLWRREHIDDVFHVEAFAAEPRVWLNSRFGQLREILESPAKRGPEAALRDLAATMIAQPALIQLALSALAAIENDEEAETVNLPSGWRYDLLTRVLPTLYPEEPDERERARRAGLDLKDPDGIASLSSRLGSVIQDMVSTHDTVEHAIRGYELARERSEESDE